MSKNYLPYGDLKRGNIKSLPFALTKLLADFTLLVERCNLPNHTASLFTRKKQY